jgi:glycosyltransferase involved in cell wall biosynthesis
MIGLDRGLVGAHGYGNSVERHKEYAERAGALDVIVPCPPGHKEKVHSKNLRAFPTNTSKFFYYFKVLRIAKRLHREAAYDLLVVQDLAAPAGAALKRTFGIPLIISIHSVFYRKGLKGINQWLVRSIKRAIGRADALRVGTEAAVRELREWGLRQPILVQPTPVDVQKFLIRTKPKNPVVRILFVGRLASEKNVALLIRVARKLTQSFVLEIIGEGPERKRLEGLAGDDERIIFRGAKLHDDLIPFYRDADIFVLPSTSESFGKVLLEAAASGCALVATRTQGAEHVITDGLDGVLVPINDEARLESVLRRLIPDHGYRQQLGVRAREAAQQYDPRTAVRRIVEFWRETAEKK